MSVLGGVCRAVEGTDVIKNLQSGNYEKAAAGALTLTAGVQQMLDKDPGLARKLGAGAFVANLGVDLINASDEIVEQKRLKPTTYINLVGDVMFAIGLMYPAIGVPMAIAGLAYTMLGWKEDKKEKRMENFYSFAKYLNSDEAQEYMKCQRETVINAQISNITVNETERIANFTISLDKLHITDALDTLTLKQIIKILSITTYTIKITLITQ
ncbi:hypothetical protein CUREO_1528 [Campylobacter ureolyticus RIGS 9880]|uniref:Uncharacterized protein n=1 Tax=Campylobacter ureolyticus RIGS 9880 TaxID=1032069 RepID=A0AAU8U151_9BACT|nr:hypothetical protein [Campylobacter ureolyticus]AKT91345.1 hypothetical protein CUREO_1528 [Campylobacter ureolyticus RIGS 9880]